MPKVQDMHADGPLRSACIRLDTTGRADLRRCDLEPTVGPLLLPWQSLGAACTHVWLDTCYSHTYTDRLDNGTDLFHPVSELAGLLPILTGLRSERPPCQRVVLAAVQPTAQQKCRTARQELFPARAPHQQKSWLPPWKTVLW